MCRQAIKCKGPAVQSFLKNVVLTLASMATVWEVLFNVKTAQRSSTLLQFQQCFINSVEWNRATDASRLKSEIHLKPPTNSNWIRTAPQGMLWLSPGNAVTGRELRHTPAVLPAVSLAPVTSICRKNWKQGSLFDFPLEWGRTNDKLSLLKRSKTSKWIS